MQEIICSLHKHILTIKFNRIEKRNALTGRMYSMLADTFNDANFDPDVRAVVLTGGETCFTGGNDLADFLDETPKNLDAPVFRFMESVLEFQKPLIAVVCGAAIGIGTTVIPHCDLVFVTRQSKFCMPFVDLGLSPEFGSSLMLPMILGPMRAGHLLLTGEVFNGQQAVDWGLATHAFDTSQECHEAAMNQAQKFVQASSGGLLASKALLKAPMLEALRDVIQTEGEILIRRLNTDETRATLNSMMK